MCTYEYSTSVTVLDTMKLPFYEKKNRITLDKIHIENRNLFENVERHQSNMTRNQIINKNKLQVKFDQRDKHYARNQRFLIWQRNKCLRRNAQMFEDIDKNKSSGYSSYLKDSEIIIKPPNSQIAQNKFSISFPRISTNENCQGLHSKFQKTLVNDKITNLSFKPKILHLKPQHTHQVLKENRKKYRIDDEDIFSELDKSVTLFQRLLRGRAYQIMKIKEITCADVLEYSKKKHISRFFDMLFKESIHIKYSENKNKMLIQQGNLSRIANEMVERKRRQIEITGRLEQDEILKQVLKIHEDVSILFCEKLMEEAIKQSAKEESLKAMMKSCKTKFYNIESEKNIEKELVSNFIIPEAHKVIMRESQSLNSNYH
ncbi:hypothetical protein AGLY_001745 [Aphis glycines]|uniref:Uncharacterized protein n=1 Tax=Aphis glycines TaxID=307491 RepID=A0A6G0U756_APHGL|nr:hypothetical protein AGLY_001745 [Aphis glycines]